MTSAFIDSTINVFIFIFLFIASIFSSVDDFLNYDIDNLLVDNYSDSQINNKNSNYQIKYNLEENMSSQIKLEFCPGINCYNLISESFKSAEFEIKCAFYEFDNINLSSILVNKTNQNLNIEILIDDAYLDEIPFLILQNLSKQKSNIKLYSDINRGTRYNNYMHNKFCVIDDKIIITGSTNPTTNGFYKNNNNLIKIESQFLAKNFENEFDQLKSGKFGYNKKSVLEYNNITLNYKNDSYNDSYLDSYIISSYFCPQDNCRKEILTLINNSKTEILFANFALTDKDLSIVLKTKKSEGIFIEGIIERRNLNLKGSTVKELNESFNIYLDNNKNNMHHKYFVIDEKYVITGSANPTGSGYDYNDENILIIENEKIAKLYKEEYLKLIN